MSAWRYHEHWTVMFRVDIGLIIPWRVIYKVLSDLIIPWRVIYKVFSDPIIPWRVIFKVFSDLIIPWRVIYKVLSDLNFSVRVIDSEDVRQRIRARWRRKEGEDVSGHTSSESSSLIRSLLESPGHLDFSRSSRINRLNFCGWWMGSRLIWNNSLGSEQVTSL